MSKETIPQSIIDKINGKYPESNSNSNQGLTEDINRLIALFREAAIWGYGLSEGRIKELEGEVERLEKIIDSIPLIK